MTLVIFKGFDKNSINKQTSKRYNCVKCNLYWF